MKPLPCLLVLCLVALCPAVLWPAAAAAQSSQAPKSVADCERIKSDLAYNQCLASFGPKRGERSSGGATAGEEDEGPAVRRPARGGRSSRLGGGRQAAAFNVVGSRSRLSRGEILGRSGR